MKRVLKGRVSIESRKTGTHALVENWGGIYTAVAYGSPDAMKALQAKLSYTTELREVCTRCGAVADVDCFCGAKQ